jgi:glyceraldehyde 3-phosphate dehydrogenase
VLECTGIFTSRIGAAKHLEAGAKKVLISAPGSDIDLTVVYGVNHKKINRKHSIVSNASCTTNCLAPVAKILNDKFGIVKGHMTTIHAYTGDQNLLDTVHKDPRRARGAALSLVPTSTGAAKAIGLVLPELSGRLEGTAVRVPVPNVSVIDLVCELKKNISVDDINNEMSKASKGPMKGVLDINSAPLVSSDFNHNPHSSIFDTTQTQLIGKKMARVMSWYDNEWGFANRMLDVAKAMGKN